MQYLVVGAGIAGLSAALSLVEDHGVPGSSVLILEASPEVGGCLRPTDLAGQLLDAGPDALLTRRPEALDLLRCLGLEDRTVTPATGRAYIGRDELVPYPSGTFLGVPTGPESLRDTPLLSENGRARAAQGFDLPAHGDATDVTVFELVARRWGDEVAECLAGPLIAAVHAGRAEYLSAEACAPQLFPDARPPAPPAVAGASPFVSLEGGLWCLPGHLRSHLEDRGVEVRTGAAVTELSALDARWVAAATGEAISADRVTIAMGALPMAGLLHAIAPAAADSLSELEHASVAIATVLLADAQFPEGSGFLVPPEGGRLLTACTWFDQKWPAARRADGRVVRLSAGRHGDARFDELDDAALTAALVRDLAELTGQQLDIGAASVSRFRDAFPQYAVGHLARVRAVAAEVEARTDGTVALCGNAFGGVGIPAVIASGRAAAGKVARP